LKLEKSLRLGYIQENFGKTSNQTSGNKFGARGHFIQLMADGVSKKSKPICERSEVNEALE
jgi:hypothetical protein